MRFYFLRHAYSINEIDRCIDTDSFFSRSFMLNKGEIVSLIRKKLKLVQKTWILIPNIVFVETFFNLLAAELFF
jgi:hypothetical protein